MVVVEGRPIRAKVYSDSVLKYLASNDGITVDLCCIRGGKISDLTKVTSMDGLGKRLRRLQYNKTWKQKQRKIAQRGHALNCDTALVTCASLCDSSNDSDDEPSVHVTSGISGDCTIASLTPPVNNGDTFQVCDDKSLSVNKGETSTDSDSDTIILDYGATADLVSPVENSVFNGEILQNSDDNECHVFNDSDSDFSLTCEESLVEELQDWANKFDVKANAIDHLLTILNKHGHVDLCSSARTLLKTPRSVELKTVSSMDYFYFGLKEMLCSSLKKIPEKELASIRNLQLSLNVDGLPLFKSSNSSVWPVLCCITNLKQQSVFPIALAVGVATSKPSDCDFLNECVVELIEATQNGIDIQGQHFSVTVKCVTCDAPARALVKCVKQYSGYYGCDKCCQKGKYYISRVIYPDLTDLQLRTDQSFRSQEQEEHHKGESPFVRLPIDMIEAFPIDYMHQVCLGVVRKLLNIWMRGPRRESRLSACQISQISTRLLKIKESIPREFARKPRELKEIDRWKATELRQFLLYTGQFVLKGILPSNLYEHFMELSVGVCVLVSPELCSKYADYAQSVLEHFVRRGAELYGDEFLVYNVHSLLHITQDAKNFGCLDACAAWKFEDYMQVIKGKVRSGKNPCTQIVKRLSEQMHVNGGKRVSEKTEKLLVRSSRPDNGFETVEGKFCNVIGDEGCPVGSYKCRVYHSAEPLFVSPCDSRILGFRQFRQNNYSVKIVKGSLLKCRCMVVDREQNVVFLTLLHDYLI